MITLKNPANSDRSVVLITDIDNTLYDFVDFYARAFRSMVHVLASDLQVEEENLIQDFARIFRGRGSVDQDYVIESLDAVRGLSLDEVHRLVIRGRRAFDLTRQKHLRPYADIPLVFKILSDAGVRIFAVTNAPYFYALNRMKSIGVLEFCYGLIAWEGPAPLHDIAAKKYSKIKERATRQLRCFRTMDKSKSKPNPVCTENSIRRRRRERTG